MDENNVRGEFNKIAKERSWARRSIGMVSVELPSPHGSSIQPFANRTSTWICMFDGRPESMARIDRQGRSAANSPSELVANRPVLLPPS
jgi:hypothetical protein